MKITTRVVIGFTLMSLIVAATHLHQARLVERLKEVDRQQARLGIQAALTSLRLHAVAADLEDFSLKYLALRDQGYRQLVRDTRQAVAEELGKLNSLVDLPRDPNLEPAGLELQSSVAGVLAQWMTIDGLLEPIATGRGRLPREADIRSAFQTFFVDLEKGIESSSRFLGESAERSQRTRDEVTEISRIALAVVLVLAVGVSTLVFRSISQSLRELMRATRRIASGDFDTRVNERRGDEMSELGALLNQMTRRLGELDQLKKEFVSSVSHDLRAPLASIQETTRLLLDEMSDGLDSTQRQLLELNYSSSSRLSRMINDLLDLSRLEAGVTGYELARVDPRKFIREALEGLHGIFRDRELDAQIIESEPPPLVMADANRMAQVMSNLLANAADFSPEGSTIRIEIARVEDYRGMFKQAGEAIPEHNGRFWRISVIDSGPGVPAEDRTRVFERFYSSDRHGHRSRKGSGLGLSIARRIVEGHGGAIWVEDGPRGKGSNFSVLLPEG